MTNTCHAPRGLYPAAGKLDAGAVSIRERDAASGSVLAVLGLLSLLGPLGTDAFLPALPAIAEDFGAPAHDVQLSLTAFTFGMAAGQLVVGTLSDGVGRRRPLVATSALMAVGAALSAVSGGATTLAAACALTGVGASGGAVLGRAVVSDTSTARDAMRRFSLLGALTTIGPVVGPLVGVVALALGGWRAVFWTMAALAAMGTVAVVSMVPESLPRDRRVHGGLAALPHRAREVLGHRTYRRSAAMIWIGFSLTFAYISASSFVVQSVLGLSAGTYAVVFAVNGTGLISAGLVTSRLVHRTDPRRVMALGVTCHASAAALLAAALVTEPGPWLLLPAMFLIAAALGFVFGPATALAVRDLRHLGGTSLAILGAVQFACAGVVAPVVGLGGEDSITAFALVTIVLAAASLISFVRLLRD